VLRAGGAGGLADVAQRRLELSVKSFGHNASSPYLYVTALALVVGLVQRDRVASWFGRAARPAYAGLCGGAAATVLGTLANDSGAVLLMIGTGFLLACSAFLYGRRAAR
jgi:hypothetical protein